MGRDLEENKPSTDEPLYRIGEVSKMLNVPTYKIAYWTNLSDEIQPVSIGTGRQGKYRQEDVEILRRMASSEGKMSIGEVSQMLDVPIYTLRFWEDQFPMFNPNRTTRGTRKFTPADIDMAKAIKAAIYDKGMTVEGAIEYINRTYQYRSPRRLRKCKSATDAIKLLDEVTDVLQDANAIAKLKSVIKYLSDEQSDRGAAAGDKNG